MRNACRATLTAALAALAIVHMSFAAVEPHAPELSSMGRLAMERVGAIANGAGIQTSPCVNEPDCESTSGPASTQSETSIAVDSTGQHIVIGFNDFRGFLTATTSLSGFMYSDNGGATFVDGGQLPVGTTTIIGGQPFPQVFGDPDV